MIDLSTTKALIFDMDGVIVDSERYWKKKEDQFFKKIVPILSVNDQKNILGQSVKNVYQKLVKEYGVKITWDEVNNQYNQFAIEIYQQETDLIQGILPLFNQLILLQKKIALASAARESWIAIVLKRFQIGKYFDEIVSSDFVNEKGKPNPAIYNYTADKLSINPENCLVIEDSCNGVLAAKAAGMQCIGLKNGFNQDQDLSRADFIITSFNQIFE